MSTANELLRRALKDLEEGLRPIRKVELIDEIRTYLSTPSDDAEEPVAWIQPNHLEKAQFMPHLCRVEPKQREDFVPLYLHPPKPAEPAARKPMTREEIIQGVTVDTSDDFHAGYWAGIRFAEKHHRISEDQ